ncbi:MAG: MYXO-CTERM sorting domain-containing protein [Polyangiales bacterium]
MIRRVFAIAGLAALGALIPEQADAACGPTYCPSYGQSTHDCPWKTGFRCRVNPVVKDNPSFSELSSLFDKVATGPSKYGSLGWSYTLNLGDGIGKPYGPTKVPARFPCVLLKAISAHESVGWNQFCLPTGPVCTGVQQTIVACDCGYGLMQVTSGMNLGETSAYDPDRVAGDAAYNASVGSQILGAKWTVTPSVGDNRVDLIEDWYFATWAYNGLAFSNNPNNTKYPADRKPYRDPGGLSAGNYPYQEIIWGLVRVPYGLKEGKGAGYTAYPISYPNRAEICASCGSPSANISDPSPTHDGNCSSGPVAMPGPSYQLSTNVEGEDRFADGSSKGIVDHVEGDTWTVDLVIKNAGDTTSPNVDLGVWVEEPYVHATHWTIESDAKNPMFEVNDADARTDQPPRDAPGQTATFHMNAFGVGESKRIRLKIQADRYSLGEADHPGVRFWVKDVTGVYSKADFDSKPTNPSGQTFNGGDLRAWGQVDVYSRTRWSFDGGTLEGWTAGGASTASIVDKTASLAATGDDPQLVGPETSFDAAAFPTLRVRGSSALSGKARVYFATKDATAFDESRAVDFDLGASTGDVVVDLSQHPAWKGTITRLRVDPAPSGMGTVVLDDLRMAGPGGTLPASDDAGTPGNSVEASGEVSGGCGCEVPSRTRSTSGLFALFALGALGARRRRR